MNNLKNKSAFSRPYSTDLSVSNSSGEIGYSGEVKKAQEGMTLLEYYAGEVLNGLLSSLIALHMDLTDERHYQIFGKMSVKLAKSLIQALEEEAGKEGAAGPNCPNDIP